jgi:hypothetical protein
MKPKLTPPGTQRLKVKCDILLSTFAFKIDLRHYNLVNTLKDNQSLDLLVLKELITRMTGNEALEVGTDG